MARLLGIVAGVGVAVAGCGGPRHVDHSAEVVSGLASSSAQRRVEAARLVPGIGFVPPAAVEPLVAMLGEADPQARRAAAEAIAYLGDGDKRLVERFLTIYRTEKDPVVQTALGEGLVRMGVVFETR
jgi:HEAT repeat protein